MSSSPRTGDKVSPTRSGMIGTALESPNADPSFLGLNQLAPERKPGTGVPIITAATTVFRAPKSGIDRTKSVKGGMDALKRTVTSGTTHYPANSITMKLTVTASVADSRVAVMVVVLVRVSRAKASAVVIAVPETPRR